MSVAGTYDCVTKTPMGDQKSTFTVVPGDDGTTFTGKNAGAMGSMDIENGKIEGNQRRDRETDQLLSDHGWLPVRVWEHEDATVAAERIAQVVESRRRGVAQRAGA